MPGVLAGERVKIIRPVRPAAIRNAVRLRPKLHRVQHPAAVGLDEIDRLARAIERETELRLRERNKTAPAESSCPTE